LEVLKNMLSEKDLVEQWTELKTLVEALEFDVLKNARGTAAAGVRARKGLRDLRARAYTLVKATVERDKLLKLEKK
jgi:hypothetical protein